MTNEELVTHIKDGAIERKEGIALLYEKNRGLIASIAKKSVGYAEMDDLMQEGAIGLIEAVDTWDDSRDVLFSSYATIHIKGKIFRFLENSTMIHLPSGIYWAVKDNKKFIQDFFNDNGRNPVKEEIERRTKKHNTDNVMKGLNACNMSSLDVQIGNSDQDGTVSEFVPSDENVADDVIDKIMQEQLSSVIWDCVDSLSDSQKDAIIKRYKYDMPIRDIGKGAASQVNSGLMLLRVRKGYRLKPFVDEMILQKAYRRGTEWNSSTERTAIELLNRRAVRF